MEFFLPDVANLKNIHFELPLRVYTSDNKLIAEFGEKKRIPVKFEQIPKQLINAVLSVEDQRFYSHEGVDPYGLARAAVELMVTGKKKQGGSTITMQVARNFFLSKRKTYRRKFNEILLAIKIDHELSKDKILELYLNKIFFGYRAYGVAAAAQIYYGKELKDLTLAQMAMLAGLPRSPSADNPLANPKVAFKRRNHVLRRMLEDGYIDRETYEKTIQAPLTAKLHRRKPEITAPYVAEMVRREMVERYGNAAYSDGYVVYTTISSKMQIAANQSLRKGLIAYDKRHGGYRRPRKNLGNPSEGKLKEWQKQLAKMPPFSNMYPAAVIAKSNGTITALLRDGEEVLLDSKSLRWRGGSRYGRIRLGDIIRIEPTKDDRWQLVQVPKVEGALVSLNPYNGSILALVGGFDYAKSSFNRVVQDHRQMGSSFKPFIYASALAHGMTLASVVNDAPIVIFDRGVPGGVWRPQNYSRRFYGPTRLRKALIYSRNVASVRVLQQVGIDFATKYITRFGFAKKDIPYGLSMALGTAEISPLQSARGFSVFANGGHLITPFVIEQIDNTAGQTLYQADPPTVARGANWEDIDAPKAPQVISPQIAYLITSVLQDVIRRGTGRRALVLQRSDIAGKTGTTNDKHDAWFAGFNPNIVTVTWVGFDRPKNLHEAGSQAALPIWIDFMRTALKNKPEITIPEPPGLVTVRIDPYTGYLTNIRNRGGIFETFRSTHVPHRRTAEDLTPFYGEQGQGPNVEYLEQLY